jgi:P-type E1-E2 ATPase
VVGHGIIAQHHNRKFLIGNMGLLQSHGVAISDTQVADVDAWQRQGSTGLYFAVDGVLAAIIIVVDPLRSGAKALVSNLHKAGIRHTAILTGDNIAVGKFVAEQVGVAEVFGDLLPQDKAAIVEKYQQAGKQVAMVGDGINDAPALAKANVGIAMGCAGTDVAMEAADIALLSDDLEKIPELMRLSRRTVQTIQQNIITANLINIVAIGFAAYGLLGPVAAAIVHNAGAILVVLNSARLLKEQKQT